jgi:hypothetical protein
MKILKRDKAMKKNSIEVDDFLIPISTKDK